MPPGRRFPLAASWGDVTRMGCKMRNPANEIALGPKHSPSKSASQPLVLLYKQ